MEFYPWGLPFTRLTTSSNAFNACVEKPVQELYSKRLPTKTTPVNKTTAVGTSSFE
jgi:hypothetical protein